MIFWIDSHNHLQDARLGDRVADGGGGRAVGAAETAHAHLRGGVAHGLGRGAVGSTDATDAGVGGRLANGSGGCRTEAHIWAISA